METERTDISELVEPSKVVELDRRQKAVFIGDTHGDLAASEIVWNRYGEEVENGQTYLVFLGDYVDRGRQSRKNIDFLLSKKENNPEGVILLLGNHDAYDRRSLRPADFWDSLNDLDYDYYRGLSSLPWLAEGRGVVSSHGALPFLSDLSKLRNPSNDPFKIENELDIRAWISVAWGDLNRSVSGARMDPLTGRPQFGKDMVLQYMQEHGWNVLIRAHQPGMQGWSFSDNALTIFTSEAYVRMGRAQERNLAIVNLEDSVEGRDDVKVLGLDSLD